MGEGFRDLNVWQKSRDLVVAVYKLTDKGVACVTRRSAVSMPSNIAEGEERNTNKDAIRFLYIAKGSLAELRTQMEIASVVGYIGKDFYVEFENQCQEIGRMLGSLIKARSPHNF